MAVREKETKGEKMKPWKGENVRSTWKKSVQGSERNWGRKRI